VAVQEYRWDKGGTEPARDYALLYEHGNENNQLGAKFLVHKDKNISN
jgi:hypothetical protein